MKKFGKIILGTLALGSVAAGAFFAIKKFIKKDSSEDFDDFEDEFEDFDAEDEVEPESREYVSINIAPEESTADATEEPVSEDEEK